MIGVKEEHFEGKGTQLDALEAHIEDYLKKDGFTVETGPAADNTRVIQAKKGGWMRTIVDADRALTITISGTPADFTVKVGVGKWLQHLGIAAAETLLLSELFLFVDVADSVWNLEIEDKLIADYKKFIG
ncbi:MAG: hypothetical protein ABSE75_03995 [Acidimicrobiales bacterium]|jgi:hypothetical protein